MIGPLVARNARQLSLRGVRQQSTAQQAAQQVKKTYVTPPLPIFMFSSVP